MVRDGLGRRVIAGVILGVKSNASVPSPQSHCHARTTCREYLGRVRRVAERTWKPNIVSNLVVIRCDKILSRVKFKRLQFSIILVPNFLTVLASIGIHEKR